MRFLVVLCLVLRVGCGVSALANVVTSLDESELTSDWRLPRTAPSMHFTSTGLVYRTTIDDNSSSWPHGNSPATPTTSPASSVDRTGFATRSALARNIAGASSDVLLGETMTSMDDRVFSTRAILVSTPIAEVKLLDQDFFELRNAMVKEVSAVVMRDEERAGGVSGVAGFYFSNYRSPQPVLDLTIDKTPLFDLVVENGETSSKGILSMDSPGNGQ